MKKIIYNVKPFNDFPLSGCFKHQVLAALKGLNIHPLPYLVNNYYIYAIKNHYLISKQIQFESYSTNFKKMGIKMLHKKVIHSEFIEEIKKQLSKAKLIIVPCDCYGLSYRKDMFNKLHSIHYLLIYGYDDNIKSFYTIDHDYLNSFQYKKKKVKYNDIENGFEAYKNNFYKKKDTLLYILYKTLNQKNSSTTFTDNIIKYKEIMKNGQLALKHYIDIFEHLIKNETLFLKKIEKTYQNFILIRQHKERMKYQLQYCFKNKRITNLFNKIIYEYTFIITILYKCYLTKKLNQNSLIKCLDKLNVIYSLEEKTQITIDETIESNQLF